MASNRNFSRLEPRKAPAEIPAVSDLGVRLTMPRKSNRAAALTVASGDRFWDKRKVAAKARRHALEIELSRASNPGAHRLTRRQKQWMENHLSTWSWNTSEDVLQAPVAATEAQLDELVTATRLPYVQRAVLKIQGLCLEQMRYIAERAPQTVLFVLVDPLAKSQQTIRAPRRA
ncbi:hypothetical protein [Arthrobacter sp. ES1]|uniref:hypothetical protein n=1 Tax=Arthrobacter sp. ES1 TaxID=1897056 RepID=UPI001CFF7362|nr:hypothetical protein [Arthrobacter sp. ES1]MCB5280590.1 hypothetical protein [Arthrobacter sp. ES1]